jgi:NADH-quinone oxidoreductase subunit C
MDMRAEITERLKLAGFNIMEADYSKNVYDATLDIEPEKLHHLVSVLIKENFYLGFMSAFHVLPAINVVYDFAQYSCRFRLHVSVTAGEKGSVPTIASVYSGAAWHEREIRDFFGIRFEGNPDMRPLILMEGDEDFHPLLKSDEVLKHIDDIVVAGDRENNSKSLTEA